MRAEFLSIVNVCVVIFICSVAEPPTFKLPRDQLSPQNAAIDFYSVRIGSLVCKLQSKEQNGAVSSINKRTRHLTVLSERIVLSDL